MGVVALRVPRFISVSGVGSGRIERGFSSASKNACAIRSATGAIDFRIAGAVAASSFGGMSRHTPARVSKKSRPLNVRVFISSNAIAST